MQIKQQISPCLWFDNQAEEAAQFYVSVFPNSKITEVAQRSQAAYRETISRAYGVIFVKRLAGMLADALQARQ